MKAGSDQLLQYCLVCFLYILLLHEYIYNISAF